MHSSFHFNYTALALCLSLVLQCYTWMLPTWHLKLWHVLSLSKDQDFIIHIRLKKLILKKCFLYGFPTLTFFFSWFTLFNMTIKRRFIRRFFFFLNRFFQHKDISVTYRYNTSRFNCAIFSKKQQNKKHSIYRYLISLDIKLGNVLFWFCKVNEKILNNNFLFVFYYTLVFWL